MDKKIMSEYERAELLLDMFLDSPKKVQQLLMMVLINAKFRPGFWGEDIIKSPIEQIFSTAFELYCKLENKDEIYLFPQHEIKCNEKKYIADFAFEADDYLSQLILRDKIKNCDFKLVIECDGYEFHQKTKEQVQRDNEREFDLKMAGYEVLRFSGTQIYKNPLKCAEDTYNYIMKRIGEK